MPALVNKNSIAINVHRSLASVLGYTYVRTYEYEYLDEYVSFSPHRGIIAGSSFILCFHKCPHLPTDRRMFLRSRAMMRCDPRPSHSLRKRSLSRIIPCFSAVVLWRSAGITFFILCLLLLLWSKLEFNKFFVFFFWLI